jgi:hypothetical protein
MAVVKPNTGAPVRVSVTTPLNTGTAAAAGGVKGVGAVGDQDLEASPPQPIKNAADTTTTDLSDCMML